MPMGLDFKGRLRKISITPASSLNAVFEAVANAFDATSALGENGSITVTILRRPGLFAHTSEPSYELHGFEIDDNGVGFTDENLAHFKQADTTNKPGGRGIGRFLWLHVFDRAEIRSVYRQAENTWKREFPFSSHDDGVNDQDTIPQPANGEALGTKVRLLAPKTDRVHVLDLSAEDLAAKLLEHFLLYFTALRGPKLTVRDSVSDAAIVVGGLYDELVGNRHKRETIDIRSYSFVLNHIFVRPTTTKLNLIKLCANKRVVTRESASDYAPEVGRSEAVTLEGKYRYHCYVTGSYLDAIADDERLILKFPSESLDDDNGLLDGPGKSGEGVTRKELNERIADSIRQHLAQHIADVRKSRESLLEDYVNKEQPQFRPYVAAAKGNLDRLPARPTKRQIELALYQAKMDGRADMDKTIKEILNKTASATGVVERRQQLIERFATESNRMAISALAEYVCTRRAVIDVLKANLEKRDDGTHEYEAVVHELFFPRFRTSDQFPVGPLEAGEREIENLWLIDERLVYHRLLTSDKPLSVLRTLLEIAPDVSVKNDEADILIFEPAFVTNENDNFGCVGIVEFKRPGKDDYTNNLNPVQQIIDIARKIHDAKQVESSKGQSVAIGEHIRFYGYAVCDVLDNLKRIIVDTYRAELTPDGMGYYFFHPTLRLLIEVIPYSKIITDAQRRNAAIFKKLGM